MMKKLLMWSLLAVGGLPLRAWPQAAVPFVKVGSVNSGFGSMALRADGTLWSWGNNQYGQTGDGSSSRFRTTPGQVNTPAAAAPGTRWTDFKLGEIFALGIRSDGTLWSWGNGGGGLLGDGTTTGRLTPGLVPAPATAAAGTTWTQVSCGAVHTLALRSDGTLWGWGDNDLRQLDDGTRQTRLSPVLIPAPTGAVMGTTWTQVSCGALHTLALRSDGTLWGWGYNTFGQLGHSVGQGTQTGVATMPVPTPAGAAPGSRWVRVEAGLDYTLALRSDGTLWSWGNSYNLAISQVMTPAGAAPGTTWTDFTAGYLFSAAVRSDGTLWTWGNNYYGQLGLNNQLSYALPQQEYTHTTWKQVAESSGHSLALDLQGSVYATGENDQGQLGDGTTTQQLIFNRSLAVALAAAPARPTVEVAPYPNPAHDYCQLPGVEPAAHLRLFNAVGRLVRATQLGADRQFDLRGLPPGLYLLTVQEGSRLAGTTRLSIY